MQQGEELNTGHSYQATLYIKVLNDITYRNKTRDYDATESVLTSSRRSNNSIIKCIGALYTQACSDGKKTNVLMLRFGLQQTSLNPFPKIDEQKMKGC